MGWEENVYGEVVNNDTKQFVNDVTFVEGAMKNVDGSLFRTVLVF